MAGNNSKTIAEIFIASKFALVGLAATGVHLLMVWLLITLAELAPLLANLLAFLTAFGVSYMGHRHFTFKAQSTSGNSFTRFALIALSAFLINNILLIYLLEKAYLSDLQSTIVAVFIIPAYTFIMSRLWAFK